MTGGHILDHVFVNTAKAALTQGAVCGRIARPNVTVDMAGNLVDLGFDIHLAGRAPLGLQAETIRELRESDLALLATERGIQPSHVAKITARHHALARCLATGMSAVEAGLNTGYTSSRISILRGDPAFEELIAHYSKVKDEDALDYQAKLAIARNLATDLIIDRMEDKPEEFSTDHALDVVKLTADRTGHGAASKTTNVNVNVNLGDRLRAARERASAPLSLPVVGGGSPERGVASHESPLAPSIIDATFTEVK